jgi:type I restriction enzyme S subunit
MNRVELGSVASVKSGFAFKSRDWEDDGVAVIKIANVKDGFVTLDGCSFVNETVARGAAAFELKPGDILISMTGYIGEVARVRNEGRMLLNQRVGKFSIKNSATLDSAYLFYCLRDPDLKAKFAAHAYGAAQPNISPSLIEQQRIPLPRLSTQRRIAGILSAYDDLIENSQRRIKILESMARALYREWFVHFRFPGHESVPRVPSPLGEIPKGWGVKRVPDCVVINPRVTVPRDGEKPFVPMGCLSNDSMLISDIESRTGNSGAKFQNSDTLFARITPCLENGKTSFVQFLPDADAVAFGSTEFIVLRSYTLTPEFVYCLARSDEFRNVAIKSMSGATGRQRVQEKCFEDFQIAHPPRMLLDEFSAIVAPSFRLIYRLHLQIQNLRRARDLLLPRLLSGQIDVEALPT